jgi:hypothetical protein
MQFQKKNRKYNCAGSLKQAFGRERTKLTGNLQQAPVSAEGVCVCVCVCVRVDVCCVCTCVCVCVCSYLIVYIYIHIVQTHPGYEKAYETAVDY